MSETLDFFSTYLPDKIKIINTIRDDIKPTLNNRVFRHFTDHSLNHSDRMLDLLKDILLENLTQHTEKSLNNDELFILLL